MAERSQIAQQSFGEFLGNAQRQWNQPKALKASFDAFTTRGPPAAEVAAATAVSSFQVSRMLSYNAAMVTHSICQISCLLSRGLRSAKKSR